MLSKIPYQDTAEEINKYEHRKKMIGYTIIGIAATVLVVDFSIGTIVAFGLGALFIHSLSSGSTSRYWG